MNIEALIPDDFNGVISIRKNNETIIKKAYGYLDIVNKIPNKTETKFATASAGKVFVAAGILKLVEKGTLNLEDTIGDILDFDLKAIDKNITIRQLLNHTSGIPDYFDERTMNDYSELWRDFPNYKIRKSMDLIPLFIDKPMMYKAGEKFKYNNTGFAALGLIIEKKTGLLFDEYLANSIFVPCGMKNTGYYELDRLPENCANAYIYDGERKEYYTIIYSVDAKGTGAGGAFTAINDIENFWDNLLYGELLPEKLLNEMMSIQSHDSDDYYGYGIWLEKTGENTFEPMFQGSDPGVSFITSYNRSKRVNITIISNLGNNVWGMKRKIEEIIELFEN
ncbi:MAG: beta-lactamase family protein [Treponema sp.]|jgi:CubicO group peptidase (beta-lactamase class C family)|nr:beta-lactamase family protein [Treponema sp.]